MSKAAGNSSPGSAKRLLYANYTTLCVIVCVLFGGPYISDNLSVIGSVKVVVEVLCCYLLVVNLILTVSLRDVELPPYRSQRTTRLKVKKLVYNTAELVLKLVLSAVVYHVVAVLFGAPFIQLLSETFHFACLLTAATVLPCMCVISPSLVTWIYVWTWEGRNATVEWSCFMSCVAAVVGAWLGAFLIPLDWDRPWQEWPVSCVLGTLLGYSVGLLVSSFFLLHRLRLGKKSKSF